MICEEVTRDLDAFVDRELAADAAAPIREHLSACASCRQRVADREALGRLVRSVPYYDAPARLRARVSGQARRTTSARRLMAWAAAAVVVVGRRGDFARSINGGARRRPGRRGGQRSCALADGRASLRCPLHRSAHREAVVPRQAGLLSAGRRSRVGWLSAGRRPARLRDGTACGRARLSAPEAHDQRVRLAGIRRHTRGAGTGGSGLSRAPLAERRSHRRDRPDDVS